MKNEIVLSWLSTSWEGVRRVHSNTIAPFSLFCPDPFWLHFGSHFGIDLEAQIATILLLCWRWSSIDRLLGFLFDVHSQQGSSRGLDTLEALSAQGGWRLSVVVSGVPGGGQQEGQEEGSPTPDDP